MHTPVRKVVFVKFNEAKQILDKTTRGEFSFYADFVNQSIKKLHLGEDSKILDIGTGWGVMAIILALNGFNVLTGEPKGEIEGCHHGKHHNEFYTSWSKSAKAVGVANRIKYRHLDAENLPFSENSFDAIFMLDTLQHVSNRKLALKECMRVVRQNGVVGIFEMNKNGVEYCRKNLKFTPDLVIPMDYLENAGQSLVEIWSGKLVNAYILRQHSS